jgi:hypothetical protein
MDEEEKDVIFIVGLGIILAGAIAIGWGLRWFFYS